MLNIPIQIVSAIKAFLNNISMKIPIEKAYLFGSYAKGNYDKNSDVDLAIFSRYFNDKDRLDNFRLLFLEAMNFSVDLQPQPFTEDDLNNPEGLVKEILKTGIEIKLDQ